MAAQKLRSRSRRARCAASRAASAGGAARNGSPGWRAGTGAGSAEAIVEFPVTSTSTSVFTACAFEKTATR